MDLSYCPSYILLPGIILVIFVIPGVLFSWFLSRSASKFEENSQTLKLIAFVETVKRLSPEDRAVIKDFIHDILPDKMTK